MAARRTSISNPLALAVLACLHERPMHPYEMASTMRERGKEQSIKLNYGSLYTVVDNLAMSSTGTSIVSFSAFFAPASTMVAGRYRTSP